MGEKRHMRETIRDWKPTTVMIKIKDGSSDITEFTQVFSRQWSNLWETGSYFRLDVKHFKGQCLD